MRALHGLVGGTAVGTAYSVMPRTHSPDRAFGMLLLVQFGLGGLGVMFLPTPVPEFGTRILVLSLAALTAFALAAAFAHPRLAESPPVERDTPHSEGRRMGKDWVTMCEPRWS